MKPDVLGIGVCLLLQDAESLVLAFPHGLHFLGEEGGHPYTYII